MRLLTKELWDDPQKNIKMHSNKDILWIINMGISFPIFTLIGVQVCDQIWYSIIKFEKET